MSYSELYRVAPLYPCLVELQAIENDTGDHGRSHTQPAAAKALLQFCSIVRRFYTGKLDDRSLFYGLLKMHVFLQITPLNPLFAPSLTSESSA